MRLIDADDAIRRIEKFYGKECNKNKYFNCKNLTYFLNKVPTVYAVPVVRCKDCKYRISVDGFEGEYGCNHENGLLGLVEDNYFCSYGERKDVNNEDYIQEDKN